MQVYQSSTMHEADFRENNTIYQRVFDIELSNRVIN